MGRCQVFPMLLADLARAHQRDLDRQLERAAVASRAGIVRPPGRFTSLLHAVRPQPSHPSGRGVSEPLRPAPARLLSLSRLRTVTATDEPLGAVLDHRCGDCEAATG
jgi:hypothetical protein